MEGKKERPGKFAEVVIEDRGMEYRYKFVFWRWLELKHPRIYTAIIIAETLMAVVPVVLMLAAKLLH